MEKNPRSLTLKSAQFLWTTLIYLFVYLLLINIEVVFDQQVTVQCLTCLPERGFIQEHPILQTTTCTAPCYKKNMEKNPRSLTLKSAQFLWTTLIYLFVYLLLINIEVVFDQQVTVQCLTCLPERGFVFGIFFSFNESSFGM